MMQRIGFAALTMMIALLPAIALWSIWLTMLALSPAEEPPAPPTAVKTPNPSQAPAAYLGPAEVLVYADPFFAGTILWWLIFCAAFLGGYTIVSTAIVRFRSAGVTPLVFRPSVLLLGSLLLGAFFVVAPWLFALCRLAMRA